MSRRRQHVLRHTALLTVRAPGTSQHRHHYLAHVSIKDVSFVGPLGKVIGYSTNYINTQSDNQISETHPHVPFIFNLLSQYNKKKTYYPHRCSLLPGTSRQS